MIRQFVPREFCLNCLGCCRFREENSVWAPCLLDEEIQELIDKDIPPATITADRRIHPVPNPSGEGFFCAFLSARENKCKIYDFRPFECQLYPFLLNLRGGKVILTVDLNCPYIKENIKTQSFKEYSDYLVKFLNSPAQVKLLKDNPQVLQAYEEVSEIIELDI